MLYNGVNNSLGQIYCDVKLPPIKVELLCIINITV